MSGKKKPASVKGRVTTSSITEETAETILTRLRASGFLVAVHNDYRLNGQFMTFWLLTHPDGSWIKGEGKTDKLALQQAELSLKDVLLSDPEGDAGRFLVEVADKLEGLACEAYNDGEDAKSKDILRDVERLRNVAVKLFKTR